MTRQINTGTLLRLLLLFILIPVTTLAQVNPRRLIFYEFPNPHTLPLTGEVTTDLNDSLWTIFHNDSGTAFMKSKDGIHWFPTNKTFIPGGKLLRRANGELYAYGTHGYVLLRSLDDGLTWTDIFEYVPSATYGNGRSQRTMKTVGVLQNNEPYIELYCSFFGYGRIYQSLTGTQWKALNLPYGATSYGREGYVHLGNSVVYYDHSGCGLDGRVFKCLFGAPLLMSADTGKSWTSLAPLMKNDTSITLVKLFGTRLVALSQGQLHYSDDKGDTWTTVTLDNCSRPYDIERNSQCYFISMETGSLVLDHDFNSWRHPEGIEPERVADIFLNNQQQVVAKTEVGYTTCVEDKWTSCGLPTYARSINFISNNHTGTDPQVVNRYHPDFIRDSSCCAECRYIPLGGDSVLLLKGVCYTPYKNIDSLFLSVDSGRNYFHIRNFVLERPYWFISHFFKTNEGYIYAIRSEKDTVYISVDNGATWKGKELGTKPPYTKHSLQAGGDFVFWKHWNAYFYSRGNLEHWDSIRLENPVFLFYNDHDRLYYFLNGNSIYAADAASLSEPTLVYEDNDTSYFYRKIVVDDKFMYLLRSDNKILYARTGQAIMTTPDHEFFIYPNPFKDEINIWYGWLDDPDLRFYLYDQNGQLVDQQATTNPMEVRLVFRSSPPGLYILRIMGKNINNVYRLLRIPD